MIKHYIILSFRFFLKNKTNSIINFIGLSVGLACSFIVLLFVMNETGFDSCHKNKEQVYRILMQNNKLNFTSPNTPFALADVIKKEFPEVKNATLIGKVRGISVELKEELFSENYCYGVTNEIFNIFTFHFLEGNSISPLKQPSDIVVTDKIAKKYFNSIHVLEEELTIIYNNEPIKFKIKGVIKELQKKSSFKADILFSKKFLLETLKKNPYLSDVETNWQKSFFTTYVKLDKNVTYKEFENKIPSLERKYHNKNIDANYRLQKLTDIHLHSTHLVNDNYHSKGNIRNIYLFSAIGLLILFVACTNYIILSTAQVINRYKEIGLRKVFGVQKRILMSQIFTESFVLLIIILPIAFTIVHFLAPLANALFSANLDLGYIYNIKFIIGLVSIVFIVGIFSGSYISLKLSRLNPNEIFNNRIDSTSSKSYFRSILVILQLTIFLILIISSITIFNQLNYMQNTDMGFNAKNIITIHINDTTFHKNYTSFKQEISKHPSIINISGCLDSPPLTTRGVSKIPHFQDKNTKILVDYIYIDFNYLETFEYKLLAGRSFSVEYPTDKELGIIVNETTVKKLGITDPIGKMIKNKKIIGIIKDFHLLSFKEEISPIIFQIVPPRNIYEINIKVKKGDISNTLKIIENEWNKFAPETNLNYSFFEDEISDLYYSEKNLAKIVIYASLISILLAVMGLFGLSLYIGKQKYKEIGIRKIHGATGIIIMRQFSKEFILLTIIANIISIPTAWYIMDKWLQNFAYHITVGGIIFVFSSFLSLFILLITISASTLKAANTNPIDILHNH